MKKVFAVMLALLMLCAGVPAWAAEGEPTLEFEIMSFFRARLCTYTLPDGGVLNFAESLKPDDVYIPGWWLYESENLKGDIVIPDYVEGKPVVGLYYRYLPSDYNPVYCLRDNKDLTSITFPSTLQRIQTAMGGTYGEWIDNCPKLEEVVFTGDGPENLEEFFPSNLKYVKLPKNVSNLEYAFGGHVDKIDLDPENPHFKMDEQGIIYTADMTTVVTAAQGAAERTSVTLPDSVTKILGGAFSSHTQLERMEGGADAITGPSNVFLYCTKLQPFRDLSGHWGEASAMWGFQNDLFQGTDLVHFSPDMVVDRGMICALVNRMAGWPDVTHDEFVEFGFPDVHDYYYYYGMGVLWCHAKGIVQGCDDGLFHPERPITREQLAAILYRYAQMEGLQGEMGAIDAFVDADAVSPYAEDAMSWAVGSGLLNGKDGSRLDPQGQASRAEAAAVLERLAGLMESD